MAECPINLTNSHIIVGNSSNEGVDVAMSGDATIDDTGAVTVSIGLGRLTDVITNYANANMFLGEDCGNATASSTGMTALGYQSLNNVTSGGTNTAIGSGTLRFATSGNGNTALGINALYLLDTGGGNVGLGVSALDNLTSGNNNIAIGYSAIGSTLVTGSNNILIGSVADVPTSSTSNYLNIGGAITGDTNFLRSI